jgi:hypothetical protein
MDGTPLRIGFRYFAARLFMSSHGSGQN